MRILWYSHRYVRIDKLFDLVNHEIMEVRMKTVDWSINSHSYVFLSHFVKESCNTSGWYVCCSSRYHFADKPHIGTILICRILLPQFFQNLPAACILSSFITVSYNSNLIPIISYQKFFINIHMISYVHYLF